MTERLVWDRDGRDWPNRAASRFVDAGGLHWHVQRMGDGPALLLLHGTGASTHSFAGLLPRLARRFSVFAVDLPGHGFTAMPRTRDGLTLGGMAAALAALVRAEGVAPDWVVGHSAGAAIAVRMVLDHRLAPRGLIGLNAALLPLDGLAGLVFPAAARLMAATPLAARLFAWRASDRAAVERLIEGTGSVLDARAIALYGRLVGDVKHVGAALGMMAGWELERLPLERLALPLALIVGERDRAVPPAQAHRVARRVPGATLHVLPGLGHLAHEERPDTVADLVVALVDAAPAARGAG